MQAGRPSNFQMHNSEGCQLESTQRGHYGSPTACLNLKYASISSPIMPSTRNGEELQPEPVHVTQQGNTTQQLQPCWPPLANCLSHGAQNSNQVAPPHRSKVCHLLETKIAHLFGSLPHDLLPARAWNGGWTLTARVREQEGQPGLV